MLPEIVVDRRGTPDKRRDGILARCRFAGDDLQKPATGKDAVSPPLRDLHQPAENLTLQPRTRLVVERLLELLL